MRPLSITLCPDGAQWFGDFSMIPGRAYCKGICKISCNDSGRRMMKGFNFNGNYKHNSIMRA